MTTVGWIAARIHLWVIDPAFLQSGASLCDPEATASRRERFPAFVRSTLLLLVAVGAVTVYTKLPSIIDNVKQRISRKTEDAIRDRIYTDLGSSRWADALNDYKKLGATSLTVSDLRGKAWALRESGRISEALQLYKEILRAAPEDSRTEADFRYATAISDQGEGNAMNIAGTVYTQLASKEQRSIYLHLKPLLENVGITVWPEEVVGPNRSPNQSQVRYFDDADGAAAAKISAILRDAGLVTKVVQLRKYQTNAGRATFEIWLSASH